MIFHDLKAIFIHTERTGGVSIRKHLLNYETNFERIGNTKHYTAQETKEKVGKLWHQYFKFGFVRNPYDRLVSWYFACKKNKDVWKNSLAIHVNNCKTFEDFIYNPHKQILIPQYKKVEGLDFIGKFEKYEEDFMELCIQLNIPYKYLQVNTSLHSHYRKYYTSEMIKIVRERFKEDFKRFNYEY